MKSWLHVAPPHITNTCNTNVSEHVWAQVHAQTSAQVKSCVAWQVTIHHHQLRDDRKIFLTAGASFIVVFLQASCDHIYSLTLKNLKSENLPV